MSDSNDQSQYYDSSQLTFNPDEYDDFGQGDDNHDFPMTDASMMMMTGGTQQYGASGASAESYRAGTTYDNVSQQQTAQPSSGTSGRKRGRPRKEASNSTAPATLEDDDAFPPFFDESNYIQPTEEDLAEQADQFGEICWDRFQQGLSGGPSE
ncbi:hypothetical protein L202_01029 [Cryptococcus amylolentus CBS 6039]|uniref:Uncharacterized protein n=1 Tax=Cryptococcus amylolentus CBS 6039 TaxID=1295533 RepID=A0A1E3I318_9TREE|nr:hypothetical protein L202_01029 [Cryptococcus amylolentus CBS 6039]ODN82745.1 hypothetical protein L202_01029 [Cryptococcus amylolentus CBS 6039]